jgi:ubiquinone biosynthesis UbiH/UbiF/VisC/COQ6 family hydroxylase
MNRVDHDVVIVGAGLVGLALAVALARAGLSVALADRSIVACADAPSAATWDARVYAISPGSAGFLHGQGVWQTLPAERVTAIEAMEILGDAGGRLHFDAYELGERALAWVVENRELNAALVASVRTEPRIEVLAPCVPSAIVWRADAAELHLAEGRTLAARLVVGADGARSWARGEAGLRHEPRPYGQTAVVANFAIEHAHRGRAFQWFLGHDGVLAWLPLPARRMSIVWSAPDVLATELLALEHTALAQRVAAAAGDELGKLELITPPAAFALAFLKLPTVVAHRFALVGDAAHGVHPLAGQGVNLGFGDAATLAAVLAARGAVGDPGAAILLERYAQRRAAPVLAMQAVTDGLARLFDMPAPWIRTLRNRGMRAVDAVGLLKRLLAQPALR